MKRLKRTVLSQTKKTKNTILLAAKSGHSGPGAVKHKSAGGAGPRPSVRTRAELRELQSLMLEAITRKLTGAMTMQRIWKDGRPVRRLAGQFIKPNDRLTSFERLEIYNRQYWFRLLDCLYDDFPGLRHVLGEKKFLAMSQAYLAKYKSRSFNLGLLGRHIPRFLADNPEWAGRLQPMALDMVRFECAQIHAFDAPINPVIDEHFLRAGDPAELRLKLQPHLTLLQLGFPLDDYSVALRSGDSMHTEAAGERRIVAAELKPVPLPRPQTVFLVVHRYENSVFFKRLEEPAFRLLENLGRGMRVGAATARALTPVFTQETAEEWQEKVRVWFLNWAELRWFCR